MSQQSEDDARRRNRRKSRIRGHPTFRMLTRDNMACPLFCDDVFLRYEVLAAGPAQKLGRSTGRGQPMELRAVSPEDAQAIAAPGPYFRGGPCTEDDFRNWNWNWRK
jgi:hypothetical protein